MLNKMANRIPKVLGLKITINTESRIPTVVLSNVKLPNFVAFSSNLRRDRLILVITLVADTTTATS
jgi:hypothetical protein